MEQTTIALNLENLLTKDSKGKLILKLTPLKKTVVNTKIPGEYTELMRVYETGDWRWDNKRNWKLDDEYSATKINCWEIHKEETCIGAGVNYLNKNKGTFGFCTKDFYLMSNWKILSIQEFYETQKITPEILKEINKYFKEKK